MTIEKYLSHGADNAISTAELQEITGLNGREIGQLVSDRRAAGACILSSVYGGYFLPADDPVTALAEVRACVETLKNRGANTLKAARALRKHERQLADQVAGQLAIGGVADV